MVRLIIRDDDCTFFTRPEDLEHVYRSIPDFPVTFAVVPTVTDVYGGCPETMNNKKPRPVGENKELVNYLKKKLIDGKCDIALHGVYHGYKFDKNGTKIPEMIWRNNEPDLIENIGKNKKYLEEVFDYPINCFVAPSNRILKEGIEAVYSNEMNYSGIIGFSFNRSFSFKSLMNYIKRWYIRLFLGFPYPGVMDYGTHLEVNATNRTSFDFLKNLFLYCKKRDLPLAINVHYWHMRDNEEYYKDFFTFIDYAITNGAIPTRLSDCFKK